LIKPPFKYPLVERTGHLSKPWYDYFESLTGVANTEADFEGSSTVGLFGAIESLQKDYEATQIAGLYTKIETLEKLIHLLPINIPQIEKITTRITDSDSPYTVKITDSVIFCDTDGGAITVNLPAGTRNRNLRIINNGSSGNNLTVDPNGIEQLFSGGAGVAFTVYDSEIINIYYDSTEGWW
jgi:hypothetical protein